MCSKNKFRMKTAFFFIIIIIINFISFVVISQENILIISHTLFLANNRKDLILKEISP